MTTITSSKTQEREKTRLTESNKLLFDHSFPGLCPQTKFLTVGQRSFAPLDNTKGLKADRCKFGANGRPGVRQSWPVWPLRFCNTQQCEVCSITGVELTGERRLNAVLYVAGNSYCLYVTAQGKSGPTKRHGDKTGNNSLC